MKAVYNVPLVEERVKVCVFFISSFRFTNASLSRVNFKSLAFCQRILTWILPMVQHHQVNWCFTDLRVVGKFKGSDVKSTSWTGVPQWLKSVKLPIHDFGSSHYRMGCEIEPHVGLHGQREVCLKILSLCPSPHSRSLSNK